MSQEFRNHTAGMAEAPFNDVESSDTIFRTSDGVHFYVHRVVLFLASPFFRDMFSLPQPPSDQIKPLIDVAESSRILDPLLRLCYPVSDPEFPESNSDSLGLIRDVLEAAFKYQVTAAIDIMKGRLRNIAPLDAYAIACRLQLEDEAARAAIRWRDSSPDLVSNGNGKIVAKGQFMDWRSTISGASYSHEMLNISAGAYYRLIQYVRTGIKKTFCAPAKMRSKNATRDIVSVRADNDAPTVSEHFNFPDSDITVLSSDDVEFRVHHLILRLSSPNLLTNAIANEEGKNVLKFQENSQTLTKLFQIMYPGTIIDNVDDISLTVSVLFTAQKYQMKKVIDAVKDRLVFSCNTKTLALYFAFVRIGLWDDATTVARDFLTRMRIEALYVADMENISAELYFQMLKFRLLAISLVVKIMAEHEGGDWLGDYETEWWSVISSSGDTARKTRGISIATPIVLRQLKKLKAEYRSFIVNKKSSDRIPDGKFNFKKLFEESSQLYQRVDSELKLLKLEPEAR